MYVYIYTYCTPGREHPQRRVQCRACQSLLWISVVYTVLGSLELHRPCVDMTSNPRYRWGGSLTCGKTDDRVHPNPVGSTGGLHRFCTPTPLSIPL